VQIYRSTPERYTLHDHSGATETPHDFGSKAAVEFRDGVLECFNRVISGDRTLIREITLNAAQNGPVQQIAQAALSEQAAEDRAAVGGAAIEAVGQAPTGQIMELELAERRLELKRKCEDWDTYKNCEDIFNGKYRKRKKDMANYCYSKSANL
jgi:hypothetical protein